MKHPVPVHEFRPGKQWPQLMDRNGKWVPNPNRRDIDLCVAVLSDGLLCYGAKTAAFHAPAS